MQQLNIFATSSPLLVSFSFRVYAASCAAFNPNICHCLSSCSASGDFCYGTLPCYQGLSVSTREILSRDEAALIFYFLKKPKKVNRLGKNLELINGSYAVVSEVCPLHQTWLQTICNLSVPAQVQIALSRERHTAPQNPIQFRFKFYRVSCNLEDFHCVLKRRIALCPK